MKMKFNAGSSLIEVLIATGVVSLVLTAIMVSLTYSIKLNAEARYRQLATQAAQEAMEVFHREKVLNSWVDFAALFTNGGTYCLATLPAPGGTISSGDCGSGASSYTLNLGAGQGFKREVYTPTVTANEVTIVIKVNWNILTETDPDVDCDKQCVQLEQTFTKWE